VLAVKSRKLREDHRETNMANAQKNTPLVDGEFSPAAICKGPWRQNSKGEKGLKVKEKKSRMVPRALVHSSNYRKRSSLGQVGRYDLNRGKTTEAKRICLWVKQKGKERREQNLPIRLCRASRLKMYCRSGERTKEGN